MRAGAEGAYMEAEEVEVEAETAPLTMTQDGKRGGKRFAKTVLRLPRPTIVILALAFGAVVAFALLRGGDPEPLPGTLLRPAQTKSFAGGDPESLPETLPPSTQTEGFAGGDPESLPETLPPSTQTEGSEPDSLPETLPPSTQSTQSTQTEGDSPREALLPSTPIEGSADTHIRFQYAESEVLAPRDFAMLAPEDRPLVPLVNRSHRVRLHHCPKTGGATLRIAIGRFLHKEVWDHEDCFMPFYRPNSLSMGIFREPRSHALSQYMHGKYNHNVRIRKTGLPDAEFKYPFMLKTHAGDVKGFGKWLDFFQRDSWTLAKGNFNTFNPIDFQTRAMTCQYPLTGRSNHEIKVAEDISPSLELAKENVLKMHWFAILDLFVPSICLMQFQFMRNMRAFCRCEHRDLFTLPRLSHGVPKHDVHEFPEEVLRKVDAITHNDKLLYEWARDLQLRRIRYVEKRANITLLCT